MSLEVFENYIRMALDGIIRRADGRDLTDVEVREYEEYELVLSHVIRFKPVARLPHWSVPTTMFVEQRFFELAQAMNVSKR